MHTATFLFRASLGLLAGTGLLAAPAARAQTFTPDTNFGTAGKVLTSLSTPPASTDLVLDAEAQAGDKLLVLARNSDGLLKLLYNANGTLDASYGTGGRLPLAALPAGFTPNASSPSATPSGSPAYDLLPDGRVLVQGRLPSLTASHLARYTAAGALDPTFGTGGVLSLGVTGSHAVQDDGKVVVATTVPVTTSGGVSSGGQMRIIRLRPDGTTDFDLTLTHLLVAPSPAAGQSAVIRNPYLAVLDDGRILAVGNAYGRSYAGTEYIALTRLTASGAPDASFGSSGTSVVYYPDKTSPSRPASPSEVGERPVLLPGGKFLLNISNTTASVLAFTADGQVDVTYGDQGQAFTTLAQVTNVGRTYPQPNGSLVLGGNSAALLAARLTSQGAFDASFAPASSGIGYLRAEFGGYTQPSDIDALVKIVTMPSGALVLVGNSTRSVSTAAHPAGTQAALARYSPTPLAARAGQAGPAISLYPNPVAGAGQDLRLMGLPAAQPVAATLYNAVGQVVLRGVVADAAPTLALPALPAGLYRLHLAGRQWTAAYPLAVQ